MLLSTAIDFSLPISDPVLKFLIILVIILISPLLLNKLKIPHLIGLIIAGAVIGEHGFNLIQRDSSIILSGTAGLLYIMFLAGLELDMNDFKKNSIRSLTFGMYTFLIPMIIGTVVGLWVFHFSLLSSILLASMFASHTLIAYPIISKLGITRDSSVSITVGGTMITDTLALLVLTIIVGMATGQADNTFWLRLGISVLLFGLIVLGVFPLIARFFFKHVTDSISQYIFVLVMVFLGSFLAQLAGIEAIIGAFLSGLALNRFIPHNSSLMNRIDFVGNAIFIPFFLLSVGMLVDYRAFTSWETLKVGIVMIIVATVAKYLAAWCTQKTFRLSTDQRRVIFGLSNAQAAATLAAVIVGYNVILGTDAEGNPIRLLNESVLNGTIMMILVTCVMASFSAQKGAHNIAAQEGITQNNGEEENTHEHILIPVSNENTVEELVNLSLNLKSPRNKHALYALKVIDNHNANEQILRQSQRLLQTVSKTAAASDDSVENILRYDINISNAITSVVLEKGITDMIVGIHKEKNSPSDTIGRLLENVLVESSINTFIYDNCQPVSTIQRHVVILPELAEKEAGFGRVINRLQNVNRNTGTKLAFYGTDESLSVLRKMLAQVNGDISYHLFTDWEDFSPVFQEIRHNDMLWVILSRKDGFSYNPTMIRVPKLIHKNCPKNNLVLIYPTQVGVNESTRYLT